VDPPGIISDHGVTTGSLPLNSPPPTTSDRYGDGGAMPRIALV